MMWLLQQIDWLSMDRNTVIGDRRVSLMTKQKTEHGFTLIELLIVLTIMGLLASLAVPIVATSIQRAKESGLKENLFVMRSAIDDYYADNAKYPDALSDLVEKKYIRFLPKDPLTNSDSSWLTEQSDNEYEQVGIIDVRSGSDKLSLEGSAYSEW